MSELRKANTGHAYFLTFTLVGWIDVFTRKELCDILIKNLRRAQKEQAVAIYSYVIMSSHVHLLHSLGPTGRSRLPSASAASDDYNHEASGREAVIEFLIVNIPARRL